MSSEPFSTLDVTLAALVGAFTLLIATAVASRQRLGVLVFIALTVKLLACAVQAALPVFIYEAGGDSLFYHEVGIEYAADIRDDPIGGLTHHLSMSLIPFPGESTTTRFAHLSGVIHYLLFDSYLAAAVLLSALGFLGQWLLYRACCGAYPDSRLRSWWTFGLLYFPTLVFWSSGLLKDPLGLLAMAYAVWGAMRLVSGRNVARATVAIVGGCYGLLLFRLQITPALALALLPWLLASLRIRADVPDSQPSGGGGKRSSMLLRWGVVVMGGASLVLILLVDPSLSPERLPALIFSLNSAYDNYTDAGSTLVGGPAFDASWTGIISAWPSFVVFALFRPFMWEASGPLMLAAALENAALLAICVTVALRLVWRPRRLLATLRSTTVISSVLFIAPFAVGVAAASPNLGTVSRYRMPLLPFVVMGIGAAMSHLSAPAWAGSTGPAGDRRAPAPMATAG